MKECYAILCTRQNLEYDIYYYKPISLLEGEYREEQDKDSDKNRIYFIDELNNEYLTINDADVISGEYYEAVGFIITEDQLLDKYPDFSLSLAKEQYLLDIKQGSYIGIFNYNTDSITIINLNLKEILESINENKEMEIGYEDKNNGLSDSSTLEKQTICFEINQFKELLQIKDGNEIKKKLQEFYNIYVKLLGIKNDNFEDSILKRFAESYQEFLNIDSLDEIKKAIQKLINLHMDLLVKLDENKSSNSKYAKDYICKIIETYELILKSNDLNYIKDKIEIVRNDSQDNISDIVSSLNLNRISNDSKIENNNKETTKIGIPNIKEIKKYFDKIIIGQDEAKKSVISAIIMNRLINDPSNKNSCLLVGPTGSGKTLIATTVSKYFDVPIEIFDTTQLTIPGYVGANLEDILLNLLKKADGDLEQAQKGIVVFNEIDKKGSEKNSDISGKGVLNTLLTFIEGTTYQINYNGRPISFNTAKLTIFATGAFTNVLESVKLREKKIGFKPNNYIEEKITLKEEDFVKYGNIPVELMGRFPVICELSGHTKDSLKKILSESTMSPIIIEQQALSKISIWISWTDEYLDAVAEEALNKKTGARALKSIVERTITTARWAVLENPEKFYGFNLTANTVDDAYNCELIDMDGKIYNLQDYLESEEEIERKRTISK